jgi:hypothetical protein
LSSSMCSLHKKKQKTDRQIIPCRQRDLARTPCSSSEVVPT